MKRCRRQPLFVALLAVVLVVTLAGVAAGETGDGSGGADVTTNATTAEATTAIGATSATSTADTTIALTQELRLVPDQTGVYAVGHRYRLPERVGLLEVTLPDGATVTSEHGFVRRDARTYAWDGATERPRIDYRMPANKSVDRDGPIAASGKYRYTDVGEWALVTRPRVSHRWGWSGLEEVELAASMSAENGATGDVIAFLGDHETYTHEAHGQRFRLIVPDHATLREGPEDVLASLGDASGRLRVGTRDETVFVVAAPTGQVDWGVRGLQTGGSDMWVRDLERLNVPENVWLHEYVHTRQEYTASPDLQWFTEGTATYYAALLALEQDRITFSQFRDSLATGERTRFETAVLTEPATWEHNANYPVGALVTGELDRRLRLTGEQRTFQDVLRRLNAQGNIVDADAFEARLRAVGNDSVAAAGRRYTRRTDRPVMWSEPRHSEAFGPTAARIASAFTEAPFRASGEYRDRDLDVAETLVLVPGERLTLGVNVTNFGGAAGTYEVPLRVDDRIESTQSGRLGPGDSERLRFEHTFETVGTHVVSAGDAQVMVNVRDPARASVTALTANRTALAAGDSVRLSATVANDASYPGMATVTLTRDGAQLGTERVSLDAAAERSVTFETTIDEVGTYAFGVGNASVAPVVVTVTDAVDGNVSADDAATPGGDDTGTPTDGDETATPTADADGTPDEDGAGFGAVVATVAILAVLFRLR